MAYSYSFAFAGAADVDYVARWFDTAGSVAGSATTGFTERASGFYLWTGTALPDSFRGGVEILNGATVVAMGGINPQDGENNDVKVSSRLGAVTGGGIYAAPSSSFEATIKNIDAGLVGTIGVRIVDGQGTTALVRGTASIVEDLAGSGIYTATLTAPATLGRYNVIWDTGSVSPATVATEPLVVTTATTVVVAGAGSSRWPPPA